MHIGFQRSGGRGEYEVVGSQGGYTAISLEGWTFNLYWPDGQVRETGLGLEPADSGKPRLRSLRDAPFQIGRMVAAMLMMPDPRRSFVDMARDPLVLQPKGYVLTRIGFGPDTEFANMVDIATIDPVFIEAENWGNAETIGVGSRWGRIRTIYDARESLPMPVGLAVDAHRQYMENGRPVTSELTYIVRKIAAALRKETVDVAVSGDPLAGLESLLGIKRNPWPELPPPSEIGESEPDVAARSAFQWRIVKARGSSGASFRSQVRHAYKGRCAFCGGAFAVKGIPSGLDAAHLLAWSSYDLDVVSNGMILCKMHHWAFDGSLIVPVFESGNYYMRFTTLASSLDNSTRDLLGRDGSIVQDEWLPDDHNARPSVRYLSRLYADLSITLAS